MRVTELRRTAYVASWIGNGIAPPQSFCRVNPAMLVRVDARNDDEAALVALTFASA